MTTSTHFFTEEQGKNIIVQETLFQEENEDSPPSDLNDFYKQLRRSLEKDKKLELHSISLSDYWRKGMIPRGLRIKKFPSFVVENQDFKNSWEAILNKCSLDLILLLITEAKKQREETQLEINSIKAKIEPLRSQNEHTIEGLEQKLKEDIETLTETIKKTKLTKFKRDTTDYQEDRVYSWTKRTRAPALWRKPRVRTVSFNLPSSSEDEYSEGPVDRQDFLDLPHHQTPNPRGGRGRGRGGGGRRKNLEPTRHSPRLAEPPRRR